MDPQQKISRSAKKKGVKDLFIGECAHKRIKNPNWKEAISWLFTSVAEDFNSE